jgi:hypothetical protein
LQCNNARELIEIEMFAQSAGSQAIAYGAAQKFSRGLPLDWPVST